MADKAPIMAIDANCDFDPNVLTHSSIEGGRFGKLDINGPAWAELARTVLSQAYKFVSPLDRNEVVPALKSITGFKIGLTEFKNAQPVPGTALWYLGQDARDIWLAAQWVARLLDVDIELTVRWKVHPDAAYPGEIRLVRYEASAQRRSFRIEHELALGDGASHS